MKHSKQGPGYPRITYFEMTIKPNCPLILPATTKKNASHSREEFAVQ